MEATGKALSAVFGRPRYVALAAVLSAASFAFYVSVPVLSVPGNSYGFFFESTPATDIAVIAALSALMGIVLSMQAYAWGNRAETARDAGIGLAGFFSGAVSSIFASATCASCVSALFSFIGFGGVVFLTEHKAEVTAITAGIVMLSFYLTSRRIAGKCDSCGIQGKGAKA
jgi:hypothetical protein